MLFYGDSAANGVKASSFVEVRLLLNPMRDKWLQASLTFVRLHGYRMQHNADALYISTKCCCQGVHGLAECRQIALKLPVTLQEISSKEQLEKFVQSQPENVLTVVNVSSNNATPCVRVFPAVMALAKNFTGYAAFARLLYETSQETQSLANELRVLEVSLPSVAGPEALPLATELRILEVSIEVVVLLRGSPCSLTGCCMRL